MMIANVFPLHVLKIVPGYNGLAAVTRTNKYNENKFFSKKKIIIIGTTDFFLKRKKNECC